MKVEDVKAMLNTTGIPWAYHHYPEKKVPRFPFGVWLDVDTDNYGADNKVYCEVHGIRLELYSKDRDWATEKSIEDVLNDYGLFWNKESDYLNDEKCYITVYYLEV